MLGGKADAMQQAAQALHFTFACCVASWDTGVLALPPASIEWP